MPKKLVLPRGPRAWSRLLLVLAVAMQALAHGIAAAEGPKLGVSVLRTEYKENPLGHRRPEAPPELAAASRPGAACANRPTRSASRGATPPSAPGAIWCGLRAGWTRTNPSTAPTAARRCNPGSGITGRCASGTAAARRPTGARRPSGRWGFSSPPTGRRAGSSRTCRKTSKTAGPAPMLRRELQGERRRRAGARLRDEPRALRDCT